MVGSGVLVEGRNPKPAYCANVSQGQAQARGRTDLVVAPIAAGTSEVLLTGTSLINNKVCGVPCGGKQWAEVPDVSELVIALLSLSAEAVVVADAHGSRVSPVSPP